uniref:DUF659 domain-containing protein n=1 Tax=Lactuca sativa TaxID=4236 RepID=A0A9R1XTL6_LACSA|nr:hypothetical protein LSAT_V11C200088390 [Lactuca sativa]
MASNDPGWHYGKTVEGKGNQWGGVTRLKHHLADDFSQALKCPRVPIEVKKVFKDAFDKNIKDRKETNKIPHFDDDVVDIDEDEEAPTNSDVFQSKGKRHVSSSGSTTNTLDVMSSPCDKTEKKKGCLVGTYEHKEVHKNLRLDVTQKICCSMYDTGIAFNVVKYDSLGPHLKWLLYMVAILMDSASNKVLAGRLVEEKYPHIYWTLCAAH